MVKSKDRHDYILPEWAPRVEPGKIKRLYELDAMGIYDEDLIEDVGWGLRARCESFIQAVRATRGEAVCPVCGSIVAHHLRKDDLLSCASCGWQATWKAYFSTIQHKQLSGAEPVLALFRDYVEKFPQAKKSPEKMFLIDRLLTGFHYYGKTTTRPVAVNLIHAPLTQVIRFLDELSLGDGSTSGLKENRQEWVEKSQNARRWGRGEKFDP